MSYQGGAIMPDGASSNTDAQDERIGEILSELYDRQGRGESLNEAEILATYPELASNLPRYLAVIGKLQQAEFSALELTAHDLLAPFERPGRERRLGAYKTAEYLGRGGMGVVLKAVDENLNRTVAIKVLRPDLAQNEGAVARFRREAKAAAALHHPNIATIYAFGNESGTSYLVMEYVDGPNLAEVIRTHGPLPTNTIRHLFGQLLAGLASAHAAGLVHRDITSSNLLLEGWPSDQSRERQRATAPAPVCEPATDQSRAHEQAVPCARTPSATSVAESAVLKIADFGLARIVTSPTRLTLPQSALGTPEYMSPEQARGDENVDHRSDLYSAGVVLYEMLTGRTPFRAETPTAILHRIQHNEPADPRKINASADSALSSLALRLMAKQREDRLASAGEVAAALESGRRIRVRSERRRRLLRWAIGICGAIALTVAAWLWTWSTNRQAALVAGAADLTISQVRVPPDTGNVVQVQYEASTGWETFHRFPENVGVTAAVLVDADGSGRRSVAIAIDPPVRECGFFMFDRNKSNGWELNLTSDLPWPDCNPTVGWACTAVTAGDLDGKPGDEIAVVASDEFEYPTRLSILDPRARAILATLWHLGDIGAQSGRYKSLWIEAEFFGPGLPAIIVHGLNNKLDGFYVPEPDDPPPLTKRTIVSFMAVIDPRKMLEEKEGLAPPACSRIAIQPSRAIYAYAFLNLSNTGKAEQPPGTATPPDAPRPEEVGGILIQPALRVVSDGSGPWFFAIVEQPRIDAHATLDLDRNLNVRQVRQHPEAATQRPDEYWISLWKSVIQNGKYVIP